MRQEGAIRRAKARASRCLPVAFAGRAPVALLFLVCLALAGCSSSEAPTTLTGLDLARSRAAPIPLHVARIARRVERLRGLRFKRVPEVLVVGPRRLARIGRRLRADAAARLAARPGRADRERRLARSDLGIERLAGLLPQPQATEASGATASAEQIGASYDYRSGRILLVNRASSSRRQLHLVLAHELTHALEDQHFDLRLATSRGPSEAAQARRALIEGSATYVAARYDRRYQGNRLRLKLEISGQRSVFAAGGQTPFAVKASTIFDYVSGPMFVAGLYDRTHGWRPVDRALRSPPQLTRYILHPRTWPASQPAAPVTLAGVRPPRPTWLQVGGGLAGEQLLLSILSEGAPPTIAQAAAAGWRGGRFAVWRAPRADCPLGCPGGDAGVVAVRLRGHADVAQLAEAFLDYALLGRLGERAGARTWRLQEGYTALAAGRRSAAIAFAPSASAAHGLARAGAAAAAPARSRS
jgi:hypothetical protein